MAKASIEYQRLEQELRSLLSLLDVNGALSELTTVGSVAVTVRTPEDFHPDALEAQAAMTRWERRFRKVMHAIFGSDADPRLPEPEDEGSRFLRARMNGLKNRRYLEDLLEDVELFGATKVRNSRFGSAEAAQSSHPSESWEHTNALGAFQCTIPWSKDHALEDALQTTARSMGHDVAFATRVRQGTLCQVRPGFASEEMAHQFKRRVYDAIVPTERPSTETPAKPFPGLHRRFQVFVSSTYEDLKHERQVAVMAILEAGHIPAGMELFAAGDKRQMEVIERWIRESDIFMLLLGTRYGSIDPASQRSYIHREFEIATELRKPSFVLELPEGEAVRRMKDPVSGMKSDDFGRLSAFREDIRSSRIVAPWTGDDSIRVGILKALGNVAEDLPASAGWFRGEALEAALRR